jgi:hypothetical protein
MERKISKKPMLSKASNMSKHRTQIQTLTKMNSVIIEDYYHMTTIDENVKWLKKVYRPSWV